jgi:integrase
MLIPTWHPRIVIMPQAQTAPVGSKIRRQSHLKIYPREEHTHMIFKKRDSKYWRYRFEFNGAVINRSTKQTNKQIAIQMESAHRTRLAKAEVGILERPSAPTVTEFAERFLAHVRDEMADRPNTVYFYEKRTAALLNDKVVPQLQLDSITSEHVSGYAGRMRKRGFQVATINRNLATLRKMTKLLTEWDEIPCRRIKLLDGETGRDRVVTEEEEAAYLAVAEPLLRNVSITLIDSGCRPDEVHRLSWSQYDRKAGTLSIWRGKGSGSRRTVDVTPRLAELLDSLPRTSFYIFPAPTKTGHINADSYKLQHKKAFKALREAGQTMPLFVTYSLRHTAITRLADTGIDAPALQYWAGHKSLQTTMKYVHMAADAIRKRIREAREKSSEKSIALRVVAKTGQ